MRSPRPPRRRAEYTGAQTRTWISSTTIQIPIQIQLDHQGPSQALLDQLIRTNFWLRRVPTTLSAILFLGMGWRVMDPRA